MADSEVLRTAMAQVITQATDVSLHTAHPAGVGANELTGGDPAYARVAITAWNQTGDGIFTATLAGPFNVPANSEVTWAGLWNGATYLDCAPAFASTVAQDTVEIQSLTFVVPQAA